MSDPSSVRLNRLAWLALAMSLCAALLPGVASEALARPTPLVQSEAELRTTNEALRTRVSDLELELAAAKARIAELERRLADANARLAAGGGPPSGGGIPAPVDEPATIDESVAPASPRALLRALQGEHAATMGPVGGWATPRERTLYFRALEKWIATANRQHRTAVQWLVRVEEVSSIGDKQARIRVVAIDPGNGIQLGDPFTMVISSALHKRLESGGLLQPGILLDLRGTLVPAVRINENRESVGSFDQPRFIGPFAEFGFHVDGQVVTQARPAAPAPPAGSP